MKHRKSDIWLLLILSAIAVYLLWSTNHTIIKWLIVSLMIISIILNELVGTAIQIGEEKKESEPEVAAISYFFTSFIYFWFFANFCFAVYGIYISFQ